MKQRKQGVLGYIHNVREVIGDPVVKRCNLPVFVSDKQAAKSLVGEEVLGNNPWDEKDDNCYRAGPRFEQGLRKYGIIT